MPVRLHVEIFTTNDRLWYSVFNVMELADFLPTLVLLLLIRLCDSRALPSVPLTPRRIPRSENFMTSSDRKDAGNLAFPDTTEESNPPVVSTGSEPMQSTNAYPVSISGVPSSQFLNHTPDYMMDLYNMYTNRHFSHLSSNIVRSYVNINDEDLFSSHANSRSQKQRIHHMTFNVTSLTPREHINLAELRLFTLIERDRYAFVGVDRKVSVYEINDYSLQRHRLLDSKHIYGRSSGWETFDVTTAVRRWARDLKTTQHVEIRIETLFHTVGDIGDMDIDTRSLTHTEPLLVVYSHDREGKKSLRKESHQLIQYQSQFLDTSVSHDSFNSTRNSTTEDNGESGRVKRSVQGPCARKPMAINFHDIGWDWILMPSQYNAYQCEGTCEFPMHDFQNPTTHAILQAIYYEKFPTSVQRVCCVPTKLKPLSILYRDENGVITFKYRYHDMVVEECGCH